MKLLLFAVLERQRMVEEINKHCFCSLLRGMPRLRGMDTTQEPGDLKKYIHIIIAQIFPTLMILRVSILSNFGHLCCSFVNHPKDANLCFTLHFT